jgi:hypothetical protein
MAVLYTEVRATFQIGVYVLHEHLCRSGSTRVSVHKYCNFKTESMK